MENPNDSTLINFCRSAFKVLDAPVTWFRERCVLPNQQNYPYYHRKYERVRTIDQCYPTDLPCRFEANEQMRRDRLVENRIANILRQRWTDCLYYHGKNAHDICDHLAKVFEDAETDLFIKYGDIPVAGTALDVYMKQKHRLLWERRHGPVGCGMK